MAKAHETILEIDLKALKYNFEYLKSRINPNSKFLAVVKAFGYGSDACEIAKTLENLGVDYFAVAYTQEGVALRNAGVKTPILVLHPQPINFNLLIERCLEPSIYSQNILNEFLDLVAKQKQTNYPIHIKFNTGLNRLGFNKNEVVFIANQLKSNSNVRVKSIFSHLAASEDLNEKTFTKNQIQTFTEISKSFQNEIGYKPMLHICNTSGILNYPKAHFDMVRSGIGLYGFGNSKLEDKNLKPIAALKSVISQIHNINSGENVGYNRKFLATKTMKAATIPLGHADGLSRQYGNGNGFVTINNKRAYIIGNVCMDMIMVDVSEIDCQQGDEVIVFGESPNAADFSQTIDSISYEIITAISQRVKRVLIK